MLLHIYERLAVVQVFPALRNGIKEEAIIIELIQENFLNISKYKIIFFYVSLLRYQRSSFIVYRDWCRNFEIWLHCLVSRIFYHPLFVGIQNCTWTFKIKLKILQSVQHINQVNRSKEWKTILEGSVPRNTQNIFLYKSL